MKKEELTNIYGSRTDGFHHSVMNALYHLDDKKAAKHKSGKHVMRTVLVFAAIAAIGTTTAAAATGFFGLFSKPVGKYGVNITTENSVSPADEETRTAYMSDDINIVTGYLPDGFYARNYTGYEIAYLDNNSYNDSWYFTAYAYEADKYNITDTYIIESEEREFNGHKAVISKQKFSQDSDRICYIVTEYFDEEDTVVRCMFIGNAVNGKYFEPDYNEMIRIMENLSIEKTAEESEAVTDYEYEEKEYAVLKYDPTEIIDSGKSKNGVTGQEYKATVSDFDGEEKELTVKVVSVTDQKDYDGFKKTDFFAAGNSITLADKYFDKDGKLVEEYKKENVENAGDGIESLARTTENTYHRHFYNVKVELSADSNIEDVCSVIGFDAFGIDEDGGYYKMSRKGEVECIARTDLDETVSLEKGSKIVINFGIIADEETENDAHFIITTANEAKNEATVTVFDVKQ